MHVVTRSIRARLLAIAAVPLVGMTAFAALATADRWQEYVTATAVADASQASTTAGALVHELQRERGMSSGFLGSKGASFGQDLATQRQQTDAAVAAFSKLDLTNLDGDAREPLRRAGSDLTRLAAVRSGVSSLSLQQSEAVRYFTDSITLLLDGVARADRAAGGDLASLATTYVDVMEAKERFGQLRAQLSAAFAADGWAPGQYVKVAGLVAAREAFLRAARAAASPESAAAIDAAAESEPVAAAAAMEKVALQAPGGGFGADAEAWFDTATAGIGELKRVEDLLATSIESEAQRRAEQALHAFVLVVGAAVLLGVGTVFLTVWVTGRMVRRIGQAAAALRAAAAGRLNVRVVDGGHDEIAEMAGSTNAALAQIADVLVLVEGRADTLRDASDRLRDASARMSAAAGQTDELTRDTAGAATELVDAIGSVRAAGAETSQALSQIEASSHAATVTAKDAVAAAGTAQASVQVLQQAVDEIVAVADAITAVARQTNLLALNATIEAQRAGVAGRGFAVVADEVKELSRETAESTDQVRKRVLAVQEGMGRVSAEIGVMADTVARIDTSQGDISTALEGQRLAAEHVDGALDGVTHTTDRISGSVRVAQQSAQTAAHSAQLTADLADEMAVTARALRTALDRFDFASGSAAGTVPAGRS